MVRRFVLCALFLASAVTLTASELTVEPRSVRAGEFVTITLSLQGEVGELDSVKLPVENLVVVGEPWVSSEFGWVNGVVSRRKTFRYRARALRAGTARVGPVTLQAGGRSETLPALSIEVIEERVSASNEPLAILQELRAAGRPLIFLVAEADRQQVHAGEQVIVTWSAFNAETVQQWQLVEAPKMPEFWTEEFATRPEEEERVWVGDQVMQKVTVRRAALYPLQSGTFTIGRMTMEAAILEPIRRGPFSIFEGNLEEVTLLSAPLTIQVKPLPPGPAVSAVGDLELQCGEPFQRNGPVIVPVTLSGIGNLRAAKPPAFDGRVRGEVQIEGGDVTVAREPQAVRMSRTWSYLIFPAASGKLEIPPISIPIFSTKSGAHTTLRCKGTMFDASVEQLPERNPPEVPMPLGRSPLQRTLPFIGGGILAIAFAWFAGTRLRSEHATRRRAAEIMREASPAEIRARAEALLPVDSAALLAEHSDRGDAWRALRSLLDARERDRDVGEGADREIARRLRDLLRYL